VDNVMPPFPSIELLKTGVRFGNSRCFKSGVSNDSAARTELRKVTVRKAITSIGLRILRHLVSVFGGDLPPRFGCSLIIHPANG
jgi:hypothetical protein